MAYLFASRLVGRSQRGGFARIGCLAFVAAALLAAGCGRSTLDDDILPGSELTDGSTGTPDSSARDSSTRDVAARDVLTRDTSTPDVISPICGPQNCAGCCSENVCFAGFAESFCGSGGQQCVNCAASGEQCEFVSSVNECQPPPPPPCNPSNCAGCCDSSEQCVAGFLDTACGQGGGSCTDCTSLGSTCDGASMPRVCQNQQAVCPATYMGCSPSLQTTPMPLHQNLCGPSDLANVASACALGAHTTACTSFFSFEKQQNTSCGLCLSAFDYDYNELKGLIACVAPFVDPSCNHESACVADCANVTCSQCPDPATALQCEINELATGQCEAYVNGVMGCVGTAIALNAPFCNPGFPEVPFGQWISAVGSQYCGN